MYGHRAYLLWNIDNAYKQLSENYSNIEKLLDTINEAFGGREKSWKPDPHLESGTKFLFIGAYCCFEGFLGEVVKEVLLSFPKKINKTNISAEIILHASTQQECVEVIVENEIRKLAFYNPQEIYKYLLKVVSDKINWTNDMIDHLYEMKSKRNLIVHGGSKINHSFMNQYRDAGVDENIGKLISISENEIKEFMDILIDMANEIRISANEKYSGWTKTRVFRDMWTEAGLTSVLSYNEFWDESIDGYMVYPKERSWGWGTSQGLLVQFFKFIHNRREFPGAVLSRFEEGSAERRIILDWLQDPFYF